MFVFTKSFETEKKKKACAGKGWKQVSSSDNLNG